MPLFSRTAVQADDASGFAKLGLYVLEGQFNWVLDVEALTSRVLHYVIAVEYIELSYFGSVDA